MLMQNLGGQTQSIMVFSELAYCGFAHILGILLMNSYNTDIYIFSNYYNLQSVLWGADWDIIV